MEQHSPLGIHAFPLWSDLGDCFSFFFVLLLLLLQEPWYVFKVQYKNMKCCITC